MHETPISPLERRRVLRDILTGDRCVTAGSSFDPISARIADSLGYEVAVMGGSVASYAVLGDPDLILITLTELAEQARRICRASRVALIVDADHGYGNALNVMRTVDELAAAGVAGLGIEDTVLPRAYGSGGAQQLVSVAEGVGKMKAAVKARGSSGMVIMARTNAVISHGVDEAIVRLRAYQDTGVDGLFVTGVKKREDLDKIAESVRLPLMIGGGAKPLFEPDYLASRGVRVWLWGHQPFSAAVKALYDAMKAVREGATPADLPGMPPESLLNELSFSAQYQALSRQLLDD